MIKFLDLKAINESFEPEISRAIMRVLNSGWYLLGNEVKSFEEEYADFIEAKHCIGVANGPPPGLEEVTMMALCGTPVPGSGAGVQIPGSAPLFNGSITSAMRPGRSRFELAVCLRRMT